jgi:hypothetical protein
MGGHISIRMTLHMSMQSMAGCNQGVGERFVEIERAVCGYGWGIAAERQRGGAQQSHADWDCTTALVSRLLD